MRSGFFLKLLFAEMFEWLEIFETAILFCLLGDIFSSEYFLIYIVSVESLYSREIDVSVYFEERQLFESVFFRSVIDN
jgi:hypothetical protein